GSTAWGWTSSTAPLPDRFRNLSSSARGKIRRVDQLAQLRFGIGPALGTLNEPAAEYGRLIAVVREQDAGLSRRHPGFALVQVDEGRAIAVRQCCRHRRTRRANLGVSLHAVGWQRSECAVAKPVHLAQIEATRLQRLARSDDDARTLRIEMHHIGRLAGGNADPAPLPDRLVEDAAMLPQHPA